MGHYTLFIANCQGFCSPAVFAKNFAGKKIRRKLPHSAVRFAKKNCQEKNISEYWSRIRTATPRPPRCGDWWQGGVTCRGAKKTPTNRGEDEWWASLELNQAPSDYESLALTNHELEALEISGSEHTQPVWPSS